MIGQILNGESVQSVATKFSVSRATIYRLLQRALGSDETTLPKLSSALIPHYRISKPIRKSALPTLQNPAGSNCAFQYLINQVSGLYEHLEEHLKAYVKDKRHGQNLTPKRFHSHLLSYLKSKQWPNDSYPYTEASMAYGAARIYFNQRVLELQQVKCPIRIVDKQIHPLRLLEEIQLDEQVHDEEAAIVIEVNGVLEKHRISRCSLIIIIDRATDYIYSHHLVLTKVPDQDDLLRVLYKLENQDEMQELHSDFFEYPPLTPQLKKIGKQLNQLQIGALSIDNAMSHHAKSIHQFMVERHNATLNFGLVKNPKRRNMLEYAFKRLNGISHRFKSTTGSHVCDPKKESAINRKSPPIVMLNDLEDLLVVEIAKHNLTSQFQLLGLSPLERTQQKLNNEFNFYNASSSHHICRTNERSIIVTLHSGTNEKSLPYVNFMYSKYKILESINLDKNKEKVLAIFNIDDIRTLRVTRLNGEALGIFRAPESWQTYPHTVKTRTYANKLTKAGKIGKSEALDKYFNHILEHKESPSYALELVRIYREFKINKYVVKNATQKILPKSTPEYPTTNRVTRPWSIYDATQAD
jgi:hypothetical protein